MTVRTWTLTVVVVTDHDLTHLGRRDAVERLFKGYAPSLVQYNELLDVEIVEASVPTRHKKDPSC
jgi:hypothetical protein